MEENMPGGSSLKIYEYLAKVGILIIVLIHFWFLFKSYSVNKNHQLLELNLMKKMIG
jgi:hypothetical protein